MHIMWYEVEMIPETLDSFQSARKRTDVPIDVVVCFNKQTYLESPIVNNVDEKFAELAKHPALQGATIIEKTNDVPFYNIGDWRRDIYSKDGYTVWGESDTLVPNNFFLLLEQTWNIRDQLGMPHVITLASRKMWDSTWTPVEHIDIATIQSMDEAPHPLSCGHRITQEELDKFNSKYDEPKLVRISPTKIDGSMVTLSPGMPQLIADDLQICSEDYCAQLSLELYGIPQYGVVNMIKGHNYSHPLKRTNTESKREDAPHMSYKNKSMSLIIKYINNLRLELDKKKQSV